MLKLIIKPKWKNVIFKSNPDFNYLTFNSGVSGIIGDVI